MTRSKTLSLAGVLGAALFVTGCSSGPFSRDRDRDDDHGRVTQTAGGNVDRDSGTARHVPRDAQVVDEGRGGNGNSLRFQSRDSGTVYLVDTTADAVVWDQHIRDGDRVEVTPGANRIEVNGKEPVQLDLKKDHRFQLYFDRR
jgi:hypothetical protein